MELTLLIVNVILLALLLGVLVWQRNAVPPPPDTGEIERKLSENFSAVAERLEKLHEATGQIIEHSRGIQDLHTLLKTPKGRGSFGEMTLEQMLGDLLGEYTEMYETQYEIEDRQRVDVAIFLGPDRERFLCVDAKFPLANATPLLNGEETPEQRKKFSRDVKERAKEIAGKYIKPPRTLDFAFMFVPSEAVSYLLLRDRKLHEDLLKMRVIPTSPNSFYAYLGALGMAFRGLKIERGTRELYEAILKVGRDFERFEERFEDVGARLEKASEAYGQARIPMEKLQRKIRKIGRGEVPKPEE